MNFLDKLKKASDENLVWVSDAGEIVNYRFAREYCSLALRRHNYFQNATTIKLYNITTDALIIALLNIRLLLVI